jgi:hypothetical protein
VGPSAYTTLSRVLGGHGRRSEQPVEVPEVQAAELAEEAGIPGTPLAPVIPPGGHVERPGPVQGEAWVLERA